MGKIYTALGLMSGTSGDGVDASIIKSDGNTNYEVIFDRYYKFTDEIYKEFHSIKKAQDDRNDYERFFSEYEKALFFLEAKITLFHIDLVNEIIKDSKIDIDFIGFHGQTIWHDPKGGYSRQLGNGPLLSKSTRKNVIYDFRANDLKNRGQGAPLVPIFHKLLAEQNKLNLPVTILNIGGISNITSINKNREMISSDIGPGNCLIDEWIRLNSDKLIDKDGLIARSGKINIPILKKALDSFYSSFVRIKRSYDVSDFDLSFVKGLTLEDGAATLTAFSADIISNKIFIDIDKISDPIDVYAPSPKDNIYICGGGRKNKFLIEKIENKIKSRNIENKINLIDDLGIDGDFVESQAFGYLAIRSFLGLPISFPETTGCKKPCTGGVLVKNY
jgi:anhydro-N-acetylmuramic acid kinase